MTDIVFAFDPAIDRPLPRLDGAVPAVAETVASAAFDALQAAAAAARQADAAALVLFGRVLDPQRASPAQAAALRRLISALAAADCRTVWVAADATACADAARMLGDPPGLVFVTPTQPLGLEIRGLPVEIHSALGPLGADVGRADLDPLHAAARRIIVGWDAGHWSHERWDDAAHAAGHGQVHALATHPQATFCVWGSRRGHAAGNGIHHLPAIQARSAHEAGAGACGLLTLLDHPPADDAAAVGLRRDPLASRADWRHAWRELPTHQVAWRTIAVDSPAGGDEELATAVWSTIEAQALAAQPLDDQGPLQIIRCHVQCGTSVARRVRVAEISAETLARVRQLHDARGFRAWCHEIMADPAESLVALGHSRSGAQPGSTTSFSTALADIVNALEQAPLRAVPADLARESAWLALELIEST